MVNVTQGLIISILSGLVVTIIIWFFTNFIIDRKKLDTILDNVGKPDVVKNSVFDNSRS